MIQLQLTILRVLMITVCFLQTVAAADLTKEMVQRKTPVSFASFCTQCTEYTVKKINAQSDSVRNLLWGTVVVSAVAGAAGGAYCIYNGIKNRRGVRYQERLPANSTAMLTQRACPSASLSEYSFDGSEAREKIYLNLFYDHAYNGPNKSFLTPAWLVLKEERYREFQRKYNINATEALQWFVRFAYKYGSVDYLSEYSRWNDNHETISPMSGLTSEMLFDGTVQFLLSIGADPFAPYYKQVDPSMFIANKEALPPAINTLSENEFNRLNEEREVNALTLFIHAGLKSVGGSDVMNSWLPYLRNFMLIYNAEFDSKVAQTILLLNLIDYMSFTRRMQAGDESVFDEEEKDSITKKKLVMFILSTMSSNYHRTPTLG